MSHQFKLYHYWRSSCSWRVRWAMQHKRLKYVSHTVNLLKGEQQSKSYLKLNPLGKVPTLLINGVAHSESLAILEWLEENYPQYPLMPTAPDDRLYVRRLAQLVSSSIFPLQNLGVQKYVAAQGLDRLAFARHWIQQGFESYEELLVSQRLAGSFSFGAAVTLADLCLVPQVYNALRFGVNMSSYPTVKNIYDRCLSLPSCSRAAPDNQPDAVK